MIILLKLSSFGIKRVDPDDPLFQPNTLREVSGKNGASKPVLNYLVLMSLLARALSTYCKS